MIELKQHFKVVNWGFDIRGWRLWCESFVAYLPYVFDSKIEVVF
jgi:hypothetical protein